ncbi:hypothetical protein GOBAR_AA01364 [Gossypium barbadense]|uniref:Reverse transcriptase domain-containing protein n=1 Tax=Gossypium barbadense TaxID=3634 RepID=A0A2P5YUG8_GOSBA|nr:hypothetical protein GOBAR_AA01364 [Gossypium barbadense]
MEDLNRFRSIGLVVGGFLRKVVGFMLSMMVEDINALFERLNFSEEEAIKVVSSKVKSLKIQGYEAWAIGKIMSDERVNKNAMYRVLKSLWFTKEEVALDVGKAIGNVVAIGWQDNDRRWTEFIRRDEQNEQNLQYGNWLRAMVGGSSQPRGNWRNGVEVIEEKKDEQKETESVRLREGNESAIIKECEKAKNDEEESGWKVVLRDTEKEGGRRKPRAMMDEFRGAMEELALVHIQTKEGCWAKEKEAREIVKNLWIEQNLDVEEKMERVRNILGPWQYKQYRKMKNKVRDLENKISKLVDNPIRENTANLLKSACLKLGHLHKVDERYWAKTRLQWLKEGDRNTRYFHVRATGRKKKNYIERLKDANGTWLYDTKDICTAARNYFCDNFKTTTASNDDPDLSFIRCCVSENINIQLDRDFTNDEIMDAFNHMDSQKFPGLDGLSGCFFKEHWETVGKDVVQLCQDVLEGKKDVDGLNETMIILISKIKDPTDITNFRLISLWRMMSSRCVSAKIKVIS